MNEILKKLSMTMKEFSKHYDIPYHTVRQWVNGTRKPPAYVIRLLNEKIERETKGEQLKINTNKIEYHCYSIDKKGITGVFRGLYIDSVEHWKKAVTRKNERAWIDVHEIIETIEVN